MPYSPLSYIEFLGNGVKEKNIVFLTHGLFGSKRNWVNTAKVLSERLNRHVVAVDLRNHGSSFWSKTHDYLSLGQDLITLADYFGRKVDLVGHSMGGKAVMSASLINPHNFGKLAVVDIGPVAYFHSEFTGFIWGMKQLDLSKINSRSQADQILSDHVPDKKIRSFLLQNMIRKESGNYDWQMNLQSIEKNIRLIMSFPQYQNQFLGQTLFLKGQESSYISENSISEIKKYFPQNTIEEINQAGHWPHVEQPKSFQDKLVNFIGEV